jgi:hypothetical protein
MVAHVTPRAVIVTASWWLSSNVAVPAEDISMADGTDDSNVKRLLIVIHVADVSRLVIEVPSSKLASITIALRNPTVPLNVAGFPDHVSALFTARAISAVAAVVTTRATEGGASSGCPRTAAETCDTPADTPRITFSPPSSMAATDELLEDKRTTRPAPRVVVKASERTILILPSTRWNAPLHATARSVVVGSAPAKGGYGISSMLVVVIHTTVSEILCDKCDAIGNPANDTFTVA